MAPRYDEAPEAIPHVYPEYYEPPSHPEPVPPSEPPVSPYGHYKQDQSTFYSGYPSSPSYSPNAAPSSTFIAPGQGSAPAPGKSRQGPFGCQLIVFVLSVIIAVLSVAVVGLAAGTGIASSRANQAQTDLAAANAALTNSTVDPNDFSKIDKGCSVDSDKVTGTTYTSTFFGKANFEIYCNANAPNPPLMGLFVGNFDDCIDACASWTQSVPKLTGNSTTSNSTSTTCAGVSFIPYWTNRTIATKGTAPGNCYLKPGPQSDTSLEVPNIGGQAVHAALLKTSTGFFSGRRV